VTEAFSREVEEPYHRDDGAKCRVHGKKNTTKLQVRFLAVEGRRYRYGAKKKKGCETAREE